MAREGERVAFEHEGKIATGKLIKFFKKIGFDDHGEIYAVIVLDECRSTCFDCDIAINSKKIIE